MPNYHVGKRGSLSVVSSTATAALKRPSLGSSLLVLTTDLTDTEVQAHSGFPGTKIVPQRVLTGLSTRNRNPATIAWGANGFLDANSDLTGGKYGAVYSAILKRYVIQNQNFRASAPGVPAFRAGVQYNATVTLPLMFLNCNFQGWGRDVDNQAVAVVSGSGSCDWRFDECAWYPLYSYTAPPVGITAGFPGLAINSVSGAYLETNHCEFNFVAGVRLDGWNPTAFTATGYARPFQMRHSKYRNVDCRKHDVNGVWFPQTDTSAFFASGAITILNCFNMPAPLVEYTDIENDPKTGARSEDAVSVYNSFFPDGQEFRYRYFRHKNLLTYDPLYTGSQQYILRRADASRISFSGTSGNLGDGVCYPNTTYKWSSNNLTADMFPHGVIFENGVIVNAAHFGMGFSSGNRMTARNVALVSPGAIRSSHPSGYSVIFASATEGSAPYTAWDFVQPGGYDSTYPAAGDSRYFYGHVMDNVLIGWFKVLDVAAQTVTPVGPYIPNTVSQASMSYVNTPATPATPASILAALDYVDGVENGWIGTIASAAGSAIGCTG